MTDSVLEDAEILRAWLESDGRDHYAAVVSRLSKCATEIGTLRDALERTDQTLRTVLAGRSVRDADEVLSANAWLLFADPTGQTAEC